MDAKTNNKKQKKARRGRRRSKPAAKAVEVSHQEPIIKTQELEVEHREPVIEAKSLLIETVESAEKTFHRNVEAMNKKIWPENLPLPKVYVKRKRMPCPECKRVLTDSMGQCVVMTSSAKKFGYFRCKCCDHRWQLPTI